MSPVLPVSISATHITLVDVDEHPRASSDSSSTATDVSSSSSLSTPTNDISPPIPTLPLNINRQDFYYRTLSVTLPYTTYTTTIVLGDSFSTTNLQPTTYAVPSSSTNAKVQTPGIATGTIVGIVIGLIAGFLALFAVFYVYLLRARQARRRRRRRRSRRGSSATAEGKLKISSRGADALDTNLDQVPLHHLLQVDLQALALGRFHLPDRRANGRIVPQGKMRR